jgi:superfamily I DNA and/or RNA helicase
VQHPEICKFPSKHFYDDMLHTVSTRQWNEEYLPIWPVKHNPVVFCHVAGAEKVLTVATEEGSEQSKSNTAEVEHSVSQ